MKNIKNAKHPADQALHCTTRIEATLKDGAGTSTGTGFFFNFQSGSSKVPVIVTNKHVIEGTETGRLIFSICDDEGNLIEGKFQRIEIRNFESQWVLHPDPNIDLAIMFIHPIQKHFNDKNNQLVSRCLAPDNMPTAEQIEELTAIEDLIMVGYPNGLWDSANNLPIIRKGTTATPTYVDYNGRKEFMIDMACFPGSSGSPVFLYNPALHQKKDGSVNMSSRVYFLGVLYAGPQHTATGELEIREIPTRKIATPISRIPNHLGFVIKAECLMGFQDLIEERVKKEEKAPKKLPTSKN